MNNAQLQQAIESARAWLLPQIDYKTTPSEELKKVTIEYVKRLQEVQVVRAGLITQTTILKEKSE